MAKLSDTQVSALKLAFANGFVDIDPDFGISRSTANALVKRDLLVSDPEDRDSAGVGSRRKVAKALGWVVPRTKDPLIALARCIKTILEEPDDFAVYSGEEYGTRHDVDEDRVLDYTDAIAVADYHVSRDQKDDAACIEQLMQLAGFTGAVSAAVGDRVVVFWPDE